MAINRILSKVSKSGTFSAITNSSTPASGTHSVTVASTTSDTVTVASSVGVTSLKKEVSDKTIAEAVYNHIRFLRNMGKTLVDINEIAMALNLSIHQVNCAVETLKKKGVRIAG